MSRASPVTTLFVLAAASCALGCDGTVQIVTPDRAATLLTAIDRAAALPVRSRGPVERSGPDGPMPEIAGRRMVIASEAATIAARVRYACRTLKIPPADAHRRAIEPDALCAGEDDSIHLSLACDRLCTAYLQVQSPRS